MSMSTRIGVGLGAAAFGYLASRTTVTVDFERKIEIYTGSQNPVYRHRWETLYKHRFYSIESLKNDILNPIGGSTVIVARLSRRNLFQVILGREDYSTLVEVSTSNSYLFNSEAYHSRRMEQEKALQQIKCIQSCADDVAFRKCMKGADYSSVN